MGSFTVFQLHCVICAKEHLYPMGFYPPGQDHLAHCGRCAFNKVLPGVTRLRTPPCLHAWAKSLIMDYLLPGPRLHENRRAAWIELQGPPIMYPPWGAPPLATCGFKWLVREFRKKPPKYIISCGKMIVVWDVDLLQYIISFLC